jgi:hypothetical protein
MILIPGRYYQLTLDLGDHYADWSPARKHHPAHAFEGPREANDWPTWSVWNAGMIFEAIQPDHGNRVGLVFTQLLSYRHVSSLFITNHHDDWNLLVEHLVLLEPGQFRLSEPSGYPFNYTPEDPT